MKRPLEDTNPPQGNNEKFAQVVELIKQGNLVELKKYNLDDVINHVNANSLTLLYFSVSEKKFEIFKYLIEKGADINLEHSIQPIGHLEADLKKQFASHILSKQLPIRPIKRISLQLIDSINSSVEVLNLNEVNELTELVFYLFYFNITDKAYSLLATYHHKLDLYRTIAEERSLLWAIVSSWISPSSKAHPGILLHDLGSKPTEVLNEGITPIWLLAFTTVGLEILKNNPSLLKNADLNAAPLSGPAKGITVGWLLANSSIGLEILKSNTESLNHANLNAAILSDGPYKGITLGWLLANHPIGLEILKSNTQLLNNVDLNAATLSDGPYKGITLGWLLANHPIGLEILKSNTQLLNKVNLDLAPPSGPHKGKTVRWLLASHSNGLDIFRSNPNLLTNANFDEGPVEGTFAGVTLGWILVDQGLDILRSNPNLLINANLNAAPVSGSLEGVTLAWLLARDTIGLDILRSNPNLLKNIDLNAAPQVNKERTVLSLILFDLHPTGPQINLIGKEILQNNLYILLKANLVQQTMLKASLEQLAGDLGPDYFFKGEEQTLINLLNNWEMEGKVQSYIKLALAQKFLETITTSIPLYNQLTEAQILGIKQRMSEMVRLLKELLTEAVDLHKKVNGILASFSMNMAAVMENEDLQKEALDLLEKISNPKLLYPLSVKDTLSLYKINFSIQSEENGAGLQCIAELLHHRSATQIPATQKTESSSNYSTKFF